MMKQFFTKSLLLLFLAFIAAGGSAPAEGSGKTIAYPETYNTHLGGASPYLGQMDLPDSPYFKHPDFYNMESNAHLTLLTKYETYQQSNDVTCGPAAALTVLYHFGTSEYGELWLAGQMGTKEKTGTNTAGMVKFFEKIGWKTESSLTSRPFASLDEFAAFVNKNLSANTPIMVENIDWGGHWRVIIGYDTMGTATLGDDMLIMADPFDTGDHLQDGYAVVPAEKFFYMWFDAHMMPKGQKEQQWLTAAPK